MGKYADDKLYRFPIAGEDLKILMTSKDKQEEFIFDVNRSSIRVTKASFQNRVRSSIVLARVDIDGPPHVNPDGTEILCPHIHFYREDYGTKWAEPLPGWITNPSDLRKTLEELMIYCNVVTFPNIESGLSI